MKAEINNWLITAKQAFDYSDGFMTWNLFLAFIPLIISFWLFRERARRSIFWWLAFLVFIAFLPNAPYVVTDIIHLVKLCGYFPTSIVTLVLIPQYIIFIVLGMEAYVISLIKLSQYLARIGFSKYNILVELSLHFLCSIGVYLGRFLRFNSWDIIHRIDTVLGSILAGLTEPKSLLIIILGFIILTILYRLLEFLTLGAMLQVRSQAKWKF